MPIATFRFYEELNDFLPNHRKKRDFEQEFKGKRSIKDIVESLGVPHTEIDLILANGESVDFGYILQDQDRVSVYPVFESVNIAGYTRLRKIPLRKTSFIADTNLGDIVKMMRLLGFDVYFDPSLPPKEIIEIARNEKRIILTRSVKLLKHKNLTHGIYIRPEKTEEKVTQILDSLDLRSDARPFSRCLLCNQVLGTVSKKEIWERIPTKTRKYCDKYTYCKVCDKIYWPGTHYEKLKKSVERLLAKSKAEDSSA